MKLKQQKRINGFEWEQQQKQCCTEKETRKELKRPPNEFLIELTK